MRAKTPASSLEHGRDWVETVTSIAVLIWRPLQLSRIDRTRVVN